MSTACEITARRAAGAPLGFFERYLTVWVFACILGGVAAGQWWPTAF